MSIAVSPENITFQRPLDRVLQHVITLTNNDTAPLAFKVKTTAPKRYCVRPNTGIISPNLSVEVKVLLQPLTEDEKKCTDKFQIQTVQVPKGIDKIDAIPAEVWSSENKKTKKLKCQFIDAAKETTTTTTKKTTSSSANKNVSQDGLRKRNSTSSENTNGNKDDPEKELKKRDVKIRHLENKIKKYEEGKVKRGAQGGYSLYIVVLVAIVGFLVGRFLDSVLGNA
eukprot:TRINITY_DN982_c0_g1_i4.p1 TRINITY_DN982_c0_g1~~TRINITY_DN982_c0_g1_i4.p1  ORF type:complete len:260 (-),score=66.75 TRINITY_DN982_c0_g1_i4:25-699(-)